MEINQDIFRRAKNKIKEKENLQYYMNVCLETKICPKCGKDGLKKYINREGFVEGIDYECPHCDWKWSNLTEE